MGPVITVNPRSGNVVNIRSTRNLTCTAIGVPVPFITWVHNGSVINPRGEVGVFKNGHTIELSNEESVGTVTSWLIINSSLFIHTGDYYCNATSPLDVYDPVMSEIAYVLDFPLGKCYYNYHYINSRLFFSFQFQKRLHRFLQKLCPRTQEHPHQFC